MAGEPSLDWLSRLRIEGAACLPDIADGLWAQADSRMADPLQALHPTALEREREQLGVRGRRAVSLGHRSPIRAN